MSAGSIVLSLLLQTGSFETDIARARKTSEKEAKKIEAALISVGRAVGGAIGLAAVGLTALTKASIDGLDALNDVADATGATIENISALGDVAKLTGTDMESVSSILVKFNNVLKEADPDSGAAAALKAIGLNAEELKKLDPAEALRRTAVALQGFANDGNKARLTQELFGKSVKEAAPFLKDLAEKGELVASATAKQAQQAEDFNKHLFAMQKNFSDVGKSIAVSILPALNEMFDRFNRARDAGQSLSTSLARGFGVGTLNSAFADPYTNLTKTNAEIDELQKRLAGGGLSRGQKSFAERRLEAAQLNAKELQAAIDDIDRKLADGTGPAAPSVGALPGTGKGKSDKAALAEKKKALDELTAAYVLQAEQVLEFKGLEEQATEATKERSDQLTKAADQYRDMLDPARELHREIEKIQALVASGALTPEEGQAAELQKIADAYKTTTENLSTFEEFTKSAAKNMQSAFADYLFDPFAEGTEGMLKGFGLMIKRMVAEAVAADIMNRLLPKAGSGGEGGGLLEGLFSLGAGLFGGARATGGPVTAGKAYLVGENQPELFVPNTSGVILPNTNMASGSGGGGSNVTLNVNVAAGTPDQVKRSAAAGAREALSAMSGIQRYA
jgi:hypothetical protein